MSSYRDDVNDTAVASDATWAGLRSLAESTARARDALLFGLAFVVAEGAVAGDAVVDRVRPVLVEHAVISDAVLDHAQVRTVVTERATVRDAVLGRTRTLLVESATASDAVMTAATSWVVEEAVASDVFMGQRRGATLVVERARAADVLVGLGRTLVVDAAQAADTALGRLRASVMVVEQAAAGDLVVDGASAAPAALVATGRASDEVMDRLRAADLVADLPASGWDELMHPGGLLGQAWTAEVGTWGMSRYAPMAFTGLAVIDGVVYGAGPDGVFALDGQGEVISAQVRTGQLDMTGSVLAHPLESRVEYELDGGAWLDVTQTQSGATGQTYTYSLPTKKADVLTNARFVLGRGLRGRHFAYTLRLTGERAYINDWSVVLAPSKRSL